jgi:hypothetical protein
MKMEKFQLSGKNSVCAGAFQLLRSRAPAQLKGNIGRRAATYLEILRKIRCLNKSFR